MSTDKTQVAVAFIDNDNVLRVTGMRNAITGTYLNSRTVTVTLTDSSGTEVTGQSWPLTLTYVPDSDGEYRATLPYDIGVTGGQTYTARVVGDGGAGLRYSEDLPIYYTRRHP